MDQADPPSAKLRAPSALAGICIHGVVGGIGGLITGAFFSLVYVLYQFEQLGPFDACFWFLLGTVFFSPHTFLAGAIPGVCAAAFGGRFRWSLALVFGSLFSAFFCSNLIDGAFVWWAYFFAIVPIVIVFDFGNRFHWKRWFLENVDVQALDQGSARLVLRCVLLALLVVIAIRAFLGSGAFIQVSITLD